MNYISRRCSEGKFAKSSPVKTRIETGEFRSDGPGLARPARPTSRANSRLSRRWSE